MVESAKKLEEGVNLTPQFYLNILVYSKDRPYQLSQFLESFFQMVSCEGLEVCVNVLYTFTPESDFAKYYEVIKLRYGSNVQWHFEDGSVDQVLKIVRLQPKVKEMHELFQYFSFMVDDMIFFRDLQLMECVNALQESNKAYALHLKLSPGIYYSHTCNKIMRLPNFEPVLKPNQPISSLKFLKFRRSETEFDWNYPFDFCGSIYRLDHVDKVIAKIQPIEKILKPNTFEFAGNQAIKMNMLAKDYPYCLCLNAPATTVITINKVQSTYNTPVYDSPCDLQTLNAYIDSNTKIDLNYYKLNQFNSVHIGNFVTTGQEYSQLKHSVAVVMPVFNQRVHYFREAVESVLRQTYSQLHLIIIDDGSTDAKLIQHMDNYAKDPRVSLIKSPQNNGIAYSLNLGIQMAKDMPNVGYIARMDSDDICFKDRLMAQVSFLELNPNIDICGTSMIILRQNSEPRVITMPSHDAIIRLNMTFYCCLGHPTVMFKQNKAAQMIYGQDEQLIEDYELWLRLCANTKLRFANIGQVLVCLRKHMDNQSTGVPIEAEIPLKMSFLGQMLHSEGKIANLVKEIPLISEEFIRVTGRPIRADTFTNIKHRKELDAIFTTLLAMNKRKVATTEFEKVLFDFVTRCLEDRKHELAIHCVGQNVDTDALRGLIQSNNQSNSGMSQLKKMLMGSGGQAPSNIKPTTR